MSQSDTAEAQAAHREYLAEVQRLVTEQVEVLFRTVTAAAERESPAAQPAGVTRDEHALTVSTGGRSAVFRIEAITDLPEGADRAQEFATGQARCVVQAPDGTTQEWVLHRVGAGEAAPQYTWMDAATEKPIDEAEVTATLRGFFT